MITTGLAVWGAVVSTTVAIVQIVQWVGRRRGKIVPIVRDFAGRGSNGQPIPGIDFVVFEAVNDAAKPVQIAGLVLHVGEHEIDLTGDTGTKNLTVITEGEDWFRMIEREELLDRIRQD